MTVYWDLDYCATVSIRRPEEKFHALQPDRLSGRYRRQAGSHIG